MLVAPGRHTVLACALLAIATRALAGALSWGYFDESRRHGPLFVALYWPVELLDQLPQRATDVLFASVLPPVLLQFGAYLLLAALLQAAWRAVRRRA